MEPPCSGLTDLSAYSSQSKSHPKDHQGLEFNLEIIYGS